MKKQQYLESKLLMEMARRKRNTGIGTLFAKDSTQHFLHKKARRMTDKKPLKKELQLFETQVN